MNIKRWDSQAVIFSCESDNIKDTLIKAINNKIDLHKADLSNCELTGIDFKSCNLTNVNFSQSNIKGCNFEKANITNLLIRNANITGCKFRAGSLKDVIHPMFCRWNVAIKNNEIHIGCISKSVKDWDIFFNSNKEFYTPRNHKDFVHIHAMYNAYKAYLKTIESYD